MSSDLRDTAAELDVAAAAGGGADLRVRSVRGSAATMGAQAMRLVIGFASTVVLARILAPDDFGLVAMVVAVTGFVSLFRELGLAVATVQAPTLSSRELSTLFWINAVGGALLALLTCALAPLIAWFYDNAQLTGIGLALSPAVLFSGLACQHRALLRRRMEFAALARIEVLALAAGTVVAVVAAMRGAGYWSLVLLPVVTECVSLIGVWWACRWRPSERAPIAEVRRLLAFGGNITGFDMANYWARNSDNVLLGRFWGAHQLGIYSRAYQVLLLPIELVSGPVGTVAVSALSRLSRTMPAHYSRAALGIVQKIALLTAPAAVLMIACPEWIIGLLLGDQWTEAAPLVGVLGIAAFTQPVSHATGWLLITQDRSRELLHWGFIGSAIAVASIAAGTPWGAFGVATAYALVGLLVRTPLLLWFVSRRGPIRAVEYAAALFIPWTAAIVSLAVAFGVRSLIGTPAPAVGLLSIMATVCLTMTLTVLVLPGGRALMVEMLDLARTVLRREALAP